MATDTAQKRMITLESADRAALDEFTEYAKVRGIQLGPIQEVPGIRDANLDPLTVGIIAFKTIVLLKEAKDVVEFIQWAVERLRSMKKTDSLISVTAGDTSVHLAHAEDPEAKTAALRSALSSPEH